MSVRLTPLLRCSVQYYRPRSFSLQLSWGSNLLLWSTCPTGVDPGSLLETVRDFMPKVRVLIAGSATPEQRSAFMSGFTRMAWGEPMTFQPSQAAMSHHEAGLKEAAPVALVLAAYDMRRASP